MRVLTTAILLCVSVCVVSLSSCKKKDQCDTISCLNGGTCSDGQCECINGYSGNRCEVEPIDTTTTIDPCGGIVCNNGGTCVDGSCACAVGYEGISCDIEWRTKFLTVGAPGTRTGCGWMAQNFSADVLPGDSVQKIVIKVPYAYNSDFAYVEATMTSPSTFTIPYQILIYDSVGSYQLNIEHGAGTLLDSIITVTYEQRTADLGGSNYCDGEFVIELQ